jgi:hypothetical protein
MSEITGTFLVSGTTNCGYFHHLPGLLDQEILDEIETKEIVEIFT